MASVSLGDTDLRHNGLHSGRLKFYYVVYTQPNSRLTIFLSLIKELLKLITQKIW